MNKFIHSFILILCLFSSQVIAQNTVGLLSYTPSKAYDGYNLIYPHNQPNVFLLDNCGEIVHVWEDEADLRPGNTAYLLENGNLVKTKRPAAVAGNPIWAGGGGGFVEIRDWDNNLLWSYELNNDSLRLHHDIEPLPNGNILMIVWELKSEEEAIQAGRDPGLLSEGELWPDYIQEINPETDEVVWKWHVWDHLVQDFDETKDNYGVVGEHPELVDINWDTSDGEADWMHTNAIDYDPINDLIIISVPTFHEVWVIDHSTSTEQAAGHSGGFSGRGGDLMYRWGNPAVYDAGTEEDQALFYQHDIHWVYDFLNPSHPEYGKLAVFNNRVGEDFSTVNTFDPAFDMYDFSFPMTDGKFDPQDFDLTITHPEPTKMYSTGLSSVQFLPNGNTLIMVGRFGYGFELTPDNEVVWEYKTPLNGGVPAAQGDTLSINNNLTFRIKRYPTDYAAFEGRDLSSQGWIEAEPDEDFCDMLISSSEEVSDYQMELYPNPADKMVTIEWDGGVYVDVEVFDLRGIRIEAMRLTGGRKYLDTSDWAPGTYFIRINQSVVRKLIVR